MAESSCIRQGHGAASPTSFDHQQEKKDQPEASLKPQEDQQQQQHPEKQRPLVEESAPKQHRHSPKDTSPLPKQQFNPDKPETVSDRLSTKPQAALPAPETTAETAPAAAPVSVTTSSKHSLRSPVFADLPVSSSASSKGIETLLSKLGGSKSRGSSVGNTNCIPSSTITITSKGKPTYEKMEALGGSGYPYGASYMVPGNAPAYKPGGSMPPPQLHLRGPWPPPHIEGFASLPVGASSLYPPYLSLSGLSPSAAPLGGVSFLPQPSTHSSDGQPVPATINPPQTDSKSLISHHHLSAMKEKDGLLDSPKHHATTMGKPRHPTLLPPKMESDVSAAMRAGKHDKLVSREGHGNDSQTRQNQHQTSGKRHVKEETHPPHVESGASKNHGSSSTGWEGSESRTHNKRAGQGGGEGGKGNSPPSLSQSKEKRENGSGDGPERKKKSSKKRLEHADENGNSLKTNDGKAIPSGKTLSDRLASPSGVGKVTTQGIGVVNSVGTVLSVGVESYTVPGDIHHTASLLKTVSPPLVVPGGLSEASKQLQKASPGVSPALSPGDASQSHTKKHSPKETLKRTPDGGGLKHGKEDKRDERLSKDTQSTGDKLTSPNSGATPPKVSPQVTATMVSAPSPTQATPTISPSNSNATVHLGYMPMYLPNTCQLSLDKETNKDAPKSGTKVHATTFVPAPGEFIPGPATNATAGVSSGKDAKCKTSPSLPVSSNGKSPTSHLGKSKSSDATLPSNGKKESPKSQLMAKAIAQATGEKCDGSSRMDDKKSSSKSPCGDHTDSAKGSFLGVESKEDMHSKHDDNERREFHGKKRHLSGNSSGLKYDSRSESKPDRTSSSHSSGKHSSRARSVSGPDPGVSGLISPREYSSKHSDRHGNEKSLEDHRRSMDLVTGRVGHPSLYYDMAMVSDRSRTDTTLPIPTYHSDCFTPSSAAHEAALARHESMLRTALMGSAHRGMPTGTGGAPLVSSPSSQPFIVSSHATSVSTSQTPSGSKKTGGSTNEGTGIQGRGTPGIKVADGRCPPIGIAVAQQRQDGDGAGTQGRHPPRSNSRSASSSPHISRVLPSSSLSDKRETDDERIGRNRDAGSGVHGRLSEREQRTARDQSPRESRSSSEVPFHVGAHRRYQHDLSANLVVTGGGTIGRPDTTIHPHLPATPHHWLPRPPSHTSATPSPLWPYGIPSSSSPMSSSTLEASPRGSPFPVGPGGMHWAQDPTTGQLMLVPPHPVHPDSPLSNLVWPRYLVPPHLQPHSHQLQQLMLNQFPYGPIPGPAHPSQHPGLLPHIPGAGSSAEVQALLQQQHEAIANMYRQAELQERNRKEQPKPPSSDPSSLKLSSDSLKCGSGHHRNRRESGDIKGEVRPESRQSERCRTGSQEPLDIKHSIQHAQPPFLQAIPVAAASQHPSLPFMYPPSVPYLYENPPPVSGPQTPSSRASQDSKDKKEFLPDRSHVIHTQIPPLRPNKDKKEGVLKSTSVQTSPAETPPAPTAKVEDDQEEENDSDVNSPSAKVSRTQQTETNQQKLSIEPNIDVVTVDSPEVTGSSTPLLSSETAIAQTKIEDDAERGTASSYEQFKQTSIQNDVKSTDVINVKEEEIKDNSLQSEKEESVLRTSNESQSEEAPPCEGDHDTDHFPADTDVPATPGIVTSTSAVSDSKPAATTVFTESASTSVPTTSRESLITNVMTTMQTFASTVDGLDQDQLAAIEGIALLSEVAERKALASRAEFWNCVAEQHRTENSDEVDDAESTTTESNVPLQGNSVSAMTSNGGCDLDDDDLAGISPGELSLKIRCPITIKKEANGRSEVSACGTPLGSAENMNPMELEMRMKLAELQRKYKEKKKELDKLQKKKDKKAREDSKNGSSPTVEKRRGRGRPRKRKFSNKSTTEAQEEAPKEVPKESIKEKEVRTLHSSATVLLEAAASLEEPVVPKKKKKKEHKTKKESQKDLKELKEPKENKEMKEQTKDAKEQLKEQKEKTTKLGKKSKKLKTKVDSSGTPLTLSGSGETKLHLKKKKDKTGTKSLSAKSGSEGQLTTLKVKGTKSGKKRTGSPFRSDVSSKKLKSASKKLHVSSLTSHDSFTSDTDSGSIIWPSKATPTKATPSSPSSASTTKPPKSPKIKTKTKFSKKLKSKEGKLGLQSGKKKKTKSKDAVARATSPAVSSGTNAVAAPPAKLDGMNGESKLKPGLLISHVYGEDSDSTLEEGSTATTNTSSQPSSWSSHKGLALLAELSSNQSSCSATPTKVKKKKIKDKTKSLSSSSTSDGASGKSKTTSGLKQPGTGKVGGKKVKVLKKKVMSSSGEKRTVVKKLKKVSKADKDSKSSIASSKSDKPKKAKLVTTSSSTTTNITTTTTTTKNESKTSQHNSPNQTGPASSAPAPQFDERSWCRRRSERIFLSDISPVQSRDISPQRKAELAEPARRKVLQSPGVKKAAEPSGPQGQSTAGSTNQGGLVTQIGSVLDALKTDPLQMRKKLIRLSAQEDEEDDDGRPQGETRRKKLKKKAKKKDKTPTQDKLNPLELALKALEQESTDSSDSDGENVPLSSLVERPSTPAPRNCVLSVNELQDGLRVLIPIDGLFHAGNVRAIQPPDVYGVVIEGGRGSRPHVFSQEQILQEAIADVKPSSTRYLPEGTRICAYWSQQYKYLYPGTVVKGSPNPTLDSNFTTVEFDDGDSGRIPLDHIRMLPQDYPLVDFEPSPIMVQRKRRRRPSETSSTTEWKMDLMKADDMDDRMEGKRREYSWRSQSSKDDAQPVSEGDNDVFLPSTPKLKKTGDAKTKKVLTKKGKSKLKLKTKAKGVSGQKGSALSSNLQQSGSSSLKQKMGKLTKLKKRKGISPTSKFSQKMLQKGQAKSFAVKAKKTKLASSAVSADRKGVPAKKKGPKKKLGSSGKAKCTVEIETVYSSEVYPDDLDYPEGLGGTLGSFDSDDSSDDESDHYTKSANTLMKKKKIKKKKKGSLSSSCNVQAFSPPRQFWRWLGKATQRRGSKGKARKLFYKSIVRDKEIIRVGECAIFLSTGRPHLPYIGRIESMWESWGGMMVVRVKWFYHPEETKGGRKPNDGKMALYLSQHVDENDVQTISHKCEVLSLDDYKQYASGKKSLNTMVKSSDIYYLAGTYDPGSGHTVSAN